MSRFEPPRGMDDLLPHEMAVKRLIEDKIRKYFLLYSYEEVETPTLEYLELFEKKSGEEIREKMFVFTDRHSRKVALRPEMTASIARLVATKLKDAPLPIRLGYLADCYRYDEPQWGRRRRFWHGGFEIIGSSKALSDAELLIISHNLFNELGIRDQYFVTGHVGILRSIMSEYRVDEDKQNRVLGKLDRGQLMEALRILQENDVPEDVRKTMDELITSSSSDIDGITKKGYDLLKPWNGAVKSLQQLEKTLHLAREGGLTSKVEVRLGFARGLEYYTGFVFEQYTRGVPLALNGGGRYDKLVKLFGGKDLPATGCSVGITRIQQYLLEKKGVPSRKEEKHCVGVASIGEEVADYAVKVASEIRKLGIGVELEVSGKRLPSAINYFAKRNVRFMVILGEKEKGAEKIALRDLKTETQVEIELKEISILRKAFSEGLPTKNNLF